MERYLCDTCLYANNCQFIAKHKEGATGCSAYINTYGVSVDRIGEICEAERDGRLVLMSCKVGTRVWVIGQNCDLCRDMYAEEPCLFGSCEYKEVFESVFGYGMIDNFGKTVFLTREEAEAALKEASRERD